MAAIFSVGVAGLSCSLTTASYSLRPPSLTAFKFTKVELLYHFPSRDDKHNSLLRRQHAANQQESWNYRQSQRNAQIGLLILWAHYFRWFNLWMSHWNFWLTPRLVHQMLVLQRAFVRVRYLLTQIQSTHIPISRSREQTIPVHSQHKQLFKWVNPHTTKHVQFVHNLGMLPPDRN